jgi:hypothetical protein
MSQPKRTTNDDIISEVRDIKAMQISQGNDIGALQGQVGLINKRHELIDAGKAAVDQYVKGQAEKLRNRQESEIRNRSIQILRDLSPIIAAAGVIIYALAQRVT